MVEGESLYKGVVGVFIVTLKWNNLKVPSNLVFIGVVEGGRASLMF